MRRILLATTALIMALTLVSCYDRIELEDVAWVQAAGFDKAPDGGILLTLQVGIPGHLRVPGTAAAGQGAHYATTSILSKTAFEAIDLASLNLGRTLSLIHTQLVLFGEDLAKSDLRSVVQAMDRFREIRGTVLVAVAKGKAADILRVNNSPLEVSPSRFIQTITQQHKSTGLFEATFFTVGFVNLFESSARSPSCPVLTLASDYEPPKKEDKGSDGGRTDPAQEYASTPRVGQDINPETIPPNILGPQSSPLDVLGDQMSKLGGGPVVMMGTAVFRGGKLVGYLTGEETRAMLMVTNDFERGAYVIPDPEVPHKPEYSLGADVKGSGTKIKVKRTGEKIQIDITVDLDVTYLSPKTQTDYSDPRMTPLAKRAIEDYIKKTIDRTIAKTQAMGSDPFGLGKKVKRTFLTWPEFRDFNWLDKFPHATINTKVNVRVKRYGLDLGPLQVPLYETVRSQD